MVDFEMRDTEELQEEGSMHWRRLTMGDWLMFGFLWVSSVYVTGLFLSPGFGQTITLFLLPIFGGVAPLIGGLLRVLLIIGFLFFALGIPGALVHNSVKYSVPPDTAGVEA